MCTTRNTIIFCLCLAFYVLFFPVTTHAELDEIYEWEKMTLEEIQEYAQNQNYKERTKDLLHLQMSKKALIAGDTNLAQRYLERIPKKNIKLSDIRGRYEAIVHFIKNDNEKSLALIQNLNLKGLKTYPEICLLKIYNMMAFSKHQKKTKGKIMLLKEEKDLKKEFERCRNQTAPYSSNDFLWPNNLEAMHFGKLEQIKGNYSSDIGYILNNQNTFRVWLKTALYLGRRDMVLENIKNFPLFVYQDKVARELLAFIFYSEGDNTRALAFIEDILTPNAESIRGNLRLKSSEYELAYGHFKLALKEKENSINALERAIPLAWLLGVWTDGPLLLSRLIGPDYNFKKRKTLDIAFKIRLEEIENAYNNMLELLVDYQNYPPHEVDLLRSYLGLRMKDKRNLSEGLTRLCRSSEGLSCWLQMQTLIWEDVTRTIDRDELISLPKDWDIQKLKNSSSHINSLANSLAKEEEILITQEEIEELDSNTVGIIPES